MELEEFPSRSISFSMKIEAKWQRNVTINGTENEYLRSKKKQEIRSFCDEKKLGFFSSLAVDLVLQILE